MIGISNHIEREMNWYERHRLFEKVAKVRSVIKSCTTESQLLSAQRMSDNLIFMQPECDEKHIANCMLIAEYGKRLIQILKSKLK